LFHQFHQELANLRHRLNQLHKKMLQESNLVLNLRLLHRRRLESCWNRHLRHHQQECSKPKEYLKE
jgi:hypothetical protein